jgi:hypothetical protein
VMTPVGLGVELDAAVGVPCPPNGGHSTRAASFP